MKNIQTFTINLLMVAMCSSLSANDKAALLVDDFRPNQPPIIRFVILNYVDFSAFNPNYTLNGTVLNDQGLGSYSFDFENLQESGNVIQAVPDVAPLNGTTTLDLVMLHRGLLFEDLTPLQAISADFDRSGSVSTKEVLALRKLILGIKDAPLAGQPFLIRKNANLSGLDMFDFANNYEQYVFDKSEVDGVEELEFEVFQYANLSEAKSEFHKSEIRASSLIVNLEDQLVSKGDIVTIPFVLVDEVGMIEGAGFKLNHPELELLDVASEEYESSMMINELESFTTVLSYLPYKPTEQLRVELTFKAKTSGQLSELLLLDDNYANELISDDYLLNKMTLNYESSEGQKEGVFVYPNPVQDALFIDASAAGEVYDITVTDLLGRHIYRGQIQNELIELNPDELNTKGMLLVRVSNEKDQIIRKVIVP